MLKEWRLRERPVQMTSEPERPCGHDRHRGACADCQRHQLDRWREQLSSVEELAASI
jgi:hypothetical protein